MAGIEEYDKDAQQLEATLYCDYCGEDIVEGQSYYEIPGFGYFHEKCIQHYKFEL